jgi:hypothetical protein
LLRKMSNSGGAPPVVFMSSHGGSPSQAPDTVRRSSQDRSAATP